MMFSRAMGKGIKCGDLRDVVVEEKVKGKNTKGQKGGEERT